MSEGGGGAGDGDRDVFVEEVVHEGVQEVEDACECELPFVGVGGDGDALQEDAQGFLDGGGEEAFALQLDGDHGLDVDGVEFAL